MATDAENSDPWTTFMGQNANTPDVINYYRIDNTWVSNTTYNIAIPVATIVGGGTTKFINQMRCGPEAVSNSTPRAYGFAYLNTATLTVTYSGTSLSGGAAAVSGFSSTTLRHDYSGWVGMQFTVGLAAPTVTSLGRIYVAGNTGSHPVEIVNAASGSVVAMTTVTPGGTAGQITYAALPAPVTLSPNTTYYLVSLEASGGDYWYDYGNVTPSSAISIPSAEYGSGGSWSSYGTVNQSYGPVSFLYTTGAPLISSYTAGTLRNDFAGQVGTQITVGPTPMIVTALGRIYIAGNTGSHAVQLVDASSKAVLASATVTPSTGTAGQFTFVGLPAPVTLPVNGSYFLVSSETSGGDRWYEFGNVTAASAVTIPNAVYGSGGAWAAYGSANQSYVPANLLYTLSTATVRVTIASSPAGVSIAVDGGTCTAPCTYAWTVGSSHKLSATTIGVGNGKQYAFTGWSDGGAAEHWITVPVSNATYTASYGTQYVLTINTTGNGTVTTSPAGSQVSPSPLQVAFNSGQVVTLTATPSSGSVFLGWTGNVASPASATTTITLSSGQTVTAHFAVALALAPASLPGGTVNQAYPSTAAGTVTGGTAPYVWTVSSGALPPGLTLSSSGVISGTPTAAGTYLFSVRVTDSGTYPQQIPASYSIVITGGVAISPVSAPNGTVNSHYSVTFTASGGTGPYTWTRTGNLPTGLGFNTSTATLGGTPSSVGTWSGIQISTTDTHGQSATITISVTITAPAPVFVNASPPPGQVGLDYSYRFTATGGTGSYTWSRTGNLPTGLGFNTSTGILSGTPDWAGTWSNIQIGVIDANTQASTVTTITVTITAAGLSVVTTELTGLTLNTAYSATLVAGGSSGSYSWTQTGGSLPAGLTMSSAGVVSGTPRVPGSYNITVRVQDSVTSAVGTVTLTVAGTLKEYIRLGGRVIAVENRD